MLRLLILFISILLTFNLSAQVENVVFTLNLKNGDKITGNIDVSEILLETDYGKLSFPIADINTINLGLMNSSFDKAKLLDLLDIIDSSNKSNTVKERAFDEIIKMNEGAIPFIKSYLQNSKEFNNSDLSVTTLYEVMLSKYNVTKNYSIYDEIKFNEKNSIEGNYSFKNIILETQYGRIKIERKLIKSIDIKTISNDGFSKDNVFKIFSNKYVSGNQEKGWLNTGILVKKGNKIIITADGTIRLASLSGNTYTPDGGVNGTPGPLDKKINYGQLLFKVGQNGKVQKAGDNIKIEASKTGILYLSIFETVFNVANTGYYTAKVLVK